MQKNNQKNDKKQNIQEETGSFFGKLGSINVFKKTKKNNDEEISNNKQTDFNDDDFKSDNSTDLPSLKRQQITSFDMLKKRLTENDEFGSLEKNKEEKSKIKDNFIAPIIPDNFETKAETDNFSMDNKDEASNYEYSSKDIILKKILQLDDDELNEKKQYKPIKPNKKNNENNENDNFKELLNSIKFDENPTENPTENNDNELPISFHLENEKKDEVSDVSDTGILLGNTFEFEHDDIFKNDLENRNNDFIESKIIESEIINFDNELSSTDEIKEASLNNSDYDISDLLDYGENIGIEEQFDKNEINIIEQNDLDINKNDNIKNIVDSKYNAENFEKTNINEFNDLKKFISENESLVNKNEDGFEIDILEKKDTKHNDLDLLNDNNYVDEDLNDSYIEKYCIEKGYAFDKTDDDLINFLKEEDGKFRKMKISGMFLLNSAISNKVFEDIDQLIASENLDLVFKLLEELCLYSADCGLSNMALAKYETLIVNNLPKVKDLFKKMLDKEQELLYLLYVY